MQFMLHCEQLRNKKKNIMPLLSLTLNKAENKSDHTLISRCGHGSEPQSNIKVNLNDCRPTTRVLVEAFLTELNATQFTHIAYCDLSINETEREITKIKQFIDQYKYRHRPGKRRSLKKTIEITTLSALAKSIFDRKNEIFSDIISQGEITDFSVNENEYKMAIQYFFQVANSNNGTLLIKQQNKKSFGIIKNLLTHQRAAQLKPCAEINAGDKLAFPFELSPQQHQSAHYLISTFKPNYQHQFFGTPQTTFSEFITTYLDLCSLGSLLIPDNHPITELQAKLLNNIHVLHPNLQAPILASIIPPQIIESKKSIFELHTEISSQKKEQKKEQKKGSQGNIHALKYDTNKTGAGVALETIAQANLADRKTTVRPNPNLLRITQATLANQTHLSLDGKCLVKADIKPEIDLNLDTMISDHIDEANLHDLIQTKYRSFCPQIVIDMDEIAEHMEILEDETLNDVIDSYGELLKLFFSGTSEQIQSDESLLPYRNALTNENGVLKNDYISLVITHATLHAVTRKNHRIADDTKCELIDLENLKILKKDHLSLKEVINLFEYITSIPQETNYACIALMLAIVRQYHDNAIPHYIQSNYLHDIPSDFKENKHKPKAFLAAAIVHYNDVNMYAEQDLLDLEMDPSNTDLGLDLDMDMDEINSDSEEEKVQKQSPRSNSSGDSNSKLTADALEAFTNHNSRDNDKNKTKHTNGIEITRLCHIALPVEDDAHSVISTATQETTHLMRLHEHSEERSRERAIATKDLKKLVSKYRRYTERNATSNMPSISIKQQLNGRYRITGDNLTVVIKDSGRKKPIDVVTAFKSPVREPLSKRQGTKTKSQKKKKAYKHNDNDYPTISPKKLTSAAGGYTCTMDYAKKVSPTMKATEEDFPDLSPRDI